MTGETYNREFLGHTLYRLKSEITELETWSVYNGDKNLGQIIEVGEKIYELIELFDK